MKTATIDRSRAWTVEEYLQLGQMETPCQLVNGQLIMSPAPTPYHQMVSRNLFRKLDEVIDSGDELLYAPIDLIVDDQNVYQPDLVYISKINRNIITNRGIEGVPDLVVEIISPSNIFIDRNTKKNMYHRMGVKEYWIVDPGNRTLEIYTQKNQETPDLYLAEEGIVSSSVLPSLQFDLKDIF